jgi:hypothetical protein
MEIPPTECPQRKVFILNFTIARRVKSKMVKRPYPELEATTKERVRSLNKNSSGVRRTFVSKYFKQAYNR